MTVEVIYKVFWLMFRTAWSAGCRGRRWETRRRCYNPCRHVLPSTSNIYVL